MWFTGKVTSGREGGREGGRKGGRRGGREVVGVVEVVPLSRSSFDDR